MTSKGAIIDIGAWLRGRGLGQYEATFRQNEIEVDILPELTEPDFEKLGIPLGHRKRLLKAIANLEATERSATAFGPASAPPPRAAGCRCPKQPVSDDALRASTANIQDLSRPSIVSLALLLTAPPLGQRAGRRQTAI
jgi:hypothetical protein